jgi:hypothetical protein
LRNCPLGDKQFAVRTGLQLIFSSTFLFSIFASSLLTDSATISRPTASWPRPRPRIREWRQPLLGENQEAGGRTLRLTLSMIIAFAMFFELRLFGTDTH